MRLSALILIAMAGCAKSGNGAGVAASPSGAAVAVELASPVRKDIAFAVEQPGTVRAFEMTPIVAKLPGYVAKVHVDMGDLVKEGQPLAEIAIPELVKEAEQKKAMVEVAAAERDLAKASVEVAAAQIASAEALVVETKAAQSRAEADYQRWQSEFTRIEGLVVGKVVDTQTLDETRKQFHSAAAMKDEAAARFTSAGHLVIETKAKLLRAKADVAAAEAKVNLATAEAGRIAALLEYTHITAPFPGVVTARMVDPGHYLQNNADPLFNVARINVVRIFVDVPEASVDAAIVGAKVTVRVGSHELPGEITRTSRVLNPDSRTMRTEIDLPNPNGELTPGSYALIRIQGTVRGAMTIPALAVLHADETAYAYQVVDGKAQKKRVLTGRSDGSAIQILGAKPASSSGDWQPLKGDERFVVGSLGALADGQAVEEKK